MCWGEIEMVVREVSLHGSDVMWREARGWTRALEKAKLFLLSYWRAATAQAQSYRCALVTLCWMNGRFQLRLAHPSFVCLSAPFQQQISCTECESKWALVCCASLQFMLIKTHPDDVSLAGEAAETSCLYLQLVALCSEPDLCSMAKPFCDAGEYWSADKLKAWGFY